MQYRRLGRTGIEVSEIGLGTWAFAGRAYGDADVDVSRRTVRRAIERGVTLFDTAPLYGNTEEDGISERILGEALGEDRNGVIVSTKFGRGSSRRGTWFSAEGVTTSVEASLQRLGRDAIDVLFFHSPFGADEIHDDVWEALDGLKRAGKIRTVGHSISKFSDTQGMARSWAAERKIDVIQVVYSLMNREATSLIADLGADGVGVIARESLANGFLSGRITKETVFAANNLNKRYTREEIADRVDYVNSLSFLVRGPVTTMPQAALRWVIDNPNVSLVLSGAKNEDELEDALRASEAGGYSAEEMRRAAEGHGRDYEAA